jgi:hypothetical protein
MYVFELIFSMIKIFGVIYLGFLPKGAGMERD